MTRHDDLKDDKDLKNSMRSIQSFSGRYFSVNQILGVLGTNNVSHLICMEILTIIDSEILSVGVGFFFN